jgi:Zn finger protein HypA/HybF involved in hydrogenase expression
VTLEEQVVIELGDIIGVQVECLECHATISSASAQWKPRQVECPNCPKSLWLAGQGDTMRLTQMANALRELMSHGPKIRLVLKADEFRKGGQ